MPTHQPQPLKVRRIAGSVSDDAGLRQCLDQLLVRVARTYAVRPDLVRRQRRGTGPTVRVRQMVMYLAHVGLGLSLCEVARLIERDRTTVVHACRVIEDERDDPAFDAALQVFEASLPAFRRCLP